jgi:general secretion pathway protein A
VYETYFKFEKSPFKVVPDPSMLYVSRSVREAMGRIEFAVRTGKGITVMTGEVGTGKTTLINRFLDKAGPDTQTAYIFNPTLSGLQLLKTLADELGIQTYGMAKVDLTRALYELLLRNRQAGRRTIVFVDEAQALSREALEELRLISNLETWHEKLLHLFLVGQPEILEKLESFNLRQLRQRVELFVQIDPMSATETRQYIEHRIRIANPLREVVFSEAATTLVHQLTGGIPRMINILCDASLLVAYVAETTTVAAAHVRDAVRTVDAAQVSFRLDRRGHRGHRWRRFLGAAGAMAAAAMLVWTFDTAVSRQSRSSDAVSGAAAAGPAAHGTRTDADLARMSPAPEPVEHAFVHVRSCRTRAEAETFAASLPLEPGTVVYLQAAVRDGTAWIRVLLGDFASLDAAAAYARRATTSGALGYAQAVILGEAGLETWQPAGKAPAAPAAPAGGARSD